MDPPRWGSPRCRVAAGDPTPAAVPVAAVPGRSQGIAGIHQATGKAQAARDVAPPGCANAEGHCRWKDATKTPELAVDVHFVKNRRYKMHNHLKFTIKC